MDLAAACGGACVLFYSARDDDGVGGIKSADTERRAGSPLAVEAVTGSDQPGWLWK